MRSDLKFNIKLTFMDFGLGGVANIFATDMTNTSNKALTKMSQNWQSKENNKQRQYEYQMWLAEQQYNTPAAQMKRYRDAGLNPFLVDSAKVGSGNTSVPPAPAMSSAPATIPAVSPNVTSLGNIIGDPLSYSLQKSKVDAEVGNLTADMYNKVIDAALAAYNDGKDGLGNKILDTGLAMLGKFGEGQSYTKIKAENVINEQRLTNDLKAIEVGIQREVGMQNAQQVLANMRKEFDVKTEQIGLWKSLERLNDATAKLRKAEEAKNYQQITNLKEEVNKIRAECVELRNRSYMEFSYACLADARTLTEDTLRGFYSKSAQIESLQRGLDYDIAKAAYDEGEYERGMRRSTFGKIMKVYGSVMDNYVAKPFNSFKSMFTDLPTLKTPKLRGKVHQGFMSPQGYKGYREWYEY